MSNYENFNYVQPCLWYICVFILISKLTKHSLPLTCSLKGGELFYFLEEKGFLCEADAVIYVRQIAQALQHLKGLNICHLDLKVILYILFKQHTIDCTMYILCCSYMYLLLDFEYVPVIII